MENIDVAVKMVEPLIPEYKKHFHVLQDMVIELPHSMKVTFVFFKIHRKVDKFPVYILNDIIPMSDVGKVIKSVPKLPDNLPKKLREDIDHYEVIVRNGAYVNSKMMNGVLSGCHPALSVLHEGQINTLIRLALSAGQCTDSIVNEYLSTKTFTV